MDPQIPTLLFALLVGHVLCDYPLQGDFLARGKNHLAPIPGIPAWQCLLAHATIHAGAVALITGSLLLALIELVLHAIIDREKCSGLYDFNFDQALHVACKAGYVAIIAAKVLR